ncbi:single-stranded-DNA-specific exonuclease RecJ [Cryomorphaceae bacterium]|nr:single-stranded-DNA-specific exonuclease RecJ [Cryomorphaceae bacterium]
MRKARWRMKPTPKGSVVEQLRSELGVPGTIAQLMAQRGITSYQEAESFFKPRLEDLHDPFTMADLEKAADRLHTALEQEERILVYGDYDVDGTTAVALVYTFLEPYTEHLDFYIPDRYAEGYGLSRTGMEYAVDNDFDLIIALDCGVKAIEEITWVQERGVDVIVADHHRPGAQLPPAYAVLDPKRSDCDYPFKELCGAGVGFKLMQGLSRKKGLDEQALVRFLDLVAVAIAADMVPVTGENRILSYFGLERLNTEPSPGLQAFVRLSKVANRLSSTDVMFKIAPKINAAGRMEHGRLAVELLIEKDGQLALQKAHGLETANEERRRTDESTTLEALAQIENEISEDAYSTVVYQPEWHKGVVGIVASRLIEKFYRPTVVLTKSNGVLAGSARSVHNFDVYAALEACSEHLEQFGGHMYAAGMTLREEQLEGFKAAFEEVVGERITEHQRQREIEIDLEVDIDELSPKFYRLLRRFEPFGPENPVPVFCARELRTRSPYVMAIGKQRDHLKMTLTGEGATKSMEAIGFGMSEWVPSLENGHSFHAVFELNENHWMGHTTLQLLVKDLDLT